MIRKFTLEQIYFTGYQALYIIIPVALIIGSTNIIMFSKVPGQYDLGKTMVAALLKAAGFEVIDLGVDVTAEQFVEAVREHSAKILALSAVMTLVAQELDRVDNALKARGLRDHVKIMIGGGGVTQELAAQLGADGYEPTALGAVKLAKELIGVD